MKEKLNKKEQHNLYTLFTIYRSNIVGKTNQFKHNSLFMNLFCLQYYLSQWSWPKIDTLVKPITMGGCGFHFAMTLNICISLLFTAKLVHGIAPGALLLSTLVPIPKNKRGNKSDSSNYRAIAISSLLEKIFDIIVLTEQCKSLETNNFQIGFKKHLYSVITRNY